MSTGIKGPNNSRKLLYILNVAEKVNNFSYTSMLAAQYAGYEFHIAGNWSYLSEAERKADEDKYGIKIYQIDFIRTPYHPQNIKAYRQLKKLLKRERFDVIHCNTPIGGLLGRLAAKSCGIQKVIYQAHGFHFYKGSPLKNWILYYPVEKALARVTDVLLTINKEDYVFAKDNLSLRNNGEVLYVPGVGIDVSYFANQDTDEYKRKKRAELGIGSSDFLLICVGRLDKNKNVETLIRSISKTDVDNIKLLICGDGYQKDFLEGLSRELGVSNRVIFAGIRNDVKDLYHSSDALVMASYREGLSRTIMEAMACGLPCIVSKIRGNTDLIDNKKGGALCEPDSADEFASSIMLLYGNKDEAKAMGAANFEKIKAFDISVVVKRMIDIYSKM